MNFARTTLCSIEKCYAVLGMQIASQAYLIYAGEANGSIRAFHGKDFQQCDIISEGMGGTMSLVPVADNETVFFASRGFYSMLNCKDSEIDIIRFNDGAFTLEKVGELPYLHRFGIVSGEDGTSYIVAASLHSHKETKEDWSNPGHLYYAVLPKNLENSFSLDFVQLHGDYHANHGFCVGVRNGVKAAFASSQEGVFEIIPPDVCGGNWCIEQLLSTPVSDIAVMDIDSDGKAEIAALMPFHGNQCRVYHEDNGEYREAYSYTEDNDFYHTVISAQLNGQKVFVIGARAGKGELFTLTAKNGKILSETVEMGVGACNGAVFRHGDTEYLLVAGRFENTADAVFYRVTP